MTANTENPAASTAAAFPFGTKGETLARLAERLRAPVLCEQVLFDVAEWRANPAAVVAGVVERFAATALAVRSSARGEDSWVASMAGAHDSIVAVPPDPTALTDAIERVIASYRTADEGHQVLVQPMVTDVAIAGVVLTRELDTGSPYYVIDYDDATGRTDAVTGGAESKTLLVHRGQTGALQSPRFRALIAVVREIEEVSGSDQLDIEFCITGAERIFILQVRPLAARRHWTPLPDQLLDSGLAGIRDRLEGLLGRDPDLVGGTTIFGDMPDWNPAEMIGSAPGGLALSLYRTLITDATWVRARGAMGYRPMADQPLLHDFAGRPYIDVRRSLNSFLPAGLPDDLGEALVDHQLARLAAHRELHDKIEFDIAITCRHLDFATPAGRLREAGFAPSAIEALGERLGHLTEQALAARAGSLDGLLRQCQSLAARRRQTAGLPPREQALALLRDCMDNGILPFAQLARHAFIGVSLLRSLVAREAITQTDSDRFMRGIHTVAADIVDDMAALSRGELAMAAFLERYGHLRPGTYDVQSWRYDERPELYLGAAERPAAIEPPFDLPSSQQAAIARLLDEAGYDLPPADLFAYVRQAVSAREQAKFLFTHNISDALVALCRWAESRDIARDDLAHLAIDRIAASDDAGVLREAIARARDDHRLTRAIRLPHLIVSADDIDVVRLPLGRPTFITDRSVTAPTRRLGTGRPDDLNGHIVMIESADPGFDWIFSHDIAGLVTKYGGTNSHMAIRCAEFGLPAAIGCGERLFDSLAQGPAVALNCAARTVRLAGG
jgi:hypothetical protein